MVAPLATVASWSLIGIADAEDIAVVSIEQSRMAGRCLVASRFVCAESGEDRVVVALRALVVPAADHDVIEHLPSELPGCGPQGRWDGRRGQTRESVMLAAEPTRLQNL